MKKETFVNNLSIATALTATCAMLLTACGVTDSEKNIDSQMSESGEAATTEKTAEIENGSETALSAEESTVEETSLYELFLNNATTVRVSDGWYHNGNLHYDPERKNKYTLEELVNVIIDGYMSPETYERIRLDKIEYAYIDCGKDGIEELALHICTPGGDDWNEFIIIKEIDGVLEAVYSDIAWARSRKNLNEYGYFYNDGSGGAAYSGYSKEYVDGDGKRHFLYNDWTMGWIGEGDQNGQLLYWDDFYEMELDEPADGEYVVLAFTFDENETDFAKDYYTYVKYIEDPNRDWNEGFRGYLFTDKIDTEGIYDDTNPVKKYMDSQNLEIYTLDEIDRMVADRENETGVTQEIKDGAEADWKELEYSFEPYIATYNDDNFLKRKEYFPLYLQLNHESYAGTSMTIYADGSIEGDYYDWNYDSDTGNSVSYENEYKAKLQVTNKIDETSYELKMTDYTLLHESGTSETNSYSQGSTSTKHFVEIPGHDDGGTRYILYCPGTQKKDIDEKALSQINEIAMEYSFEDGVLQEYILYGIDGSGYVWRGY